MPAPQSIEDQIKHHLSNWAADPARALRTDGKHGWVLAKEHARRNYYLDAWADLIAGREHRWAHALNSSQAFAVNLFAPAIASRAGGLALWQSLWPNHGEPAPERVSIDFEYLGPDGTAIGPTWLGESGQATQVDVAIAAGFPGSVRRVFLIEVKLRETEFGSCRGARAPGSDCLSLTQVLASSSTKCWMEMEEGRKYWQVIQSEPRPLLFERALNEPCPWRRSLYQVMRNWAFGQALVRSGAAGDFRVGLCVHPDNKVALQLHARVAGHANVFDAFNAMAPAPGVIQVQPSRVIEILGPHAPDGWAQYMRTRYMLAN
jgi:hypothetical protein